MEPFDVKVNNFITGGVNTSISDPFNCGTNSFYNVDGIEEFSKARNGLVKNNRPMDPEDYAKKVVYDFETSKIGKVNYYRGTLATVSYILQYFPRLIILKMIMIRFKLTKTFESIRTLYN